MAFVTVIPLRTFLKSRAVGIRPYTSPRATVTGPKKPENFTIPEPRTFYIRPDKALDIATGTFGQLLRVGAGVFVDGYRMRTKDGKLVEYSSSLPNSRPTLPLRLFEFEACPFCRKVREAVSMLDLDVLVFPCPKDGKVYREYVKQKGGKTMFPYIEDPNTGFESYESDDIIRYLYKTYGPSSGVVPAVISSASSISAGLASSVRRTKGRSRVSKAVPAKQPIELYGYEASPFVKLVRETITELEIPYYLHTTARGSKTRGEMKETFGRFQVPYIVDPNTGVSMFESAEICEYLRKTYGPSAPGAVAIPEPGSVFMPDSPLGEGGSQAEPIDGKSLNPQPIKDEVLEEYCEDNPETDECRVYED